MKLTIPNHRNIDRVFWFLFLTLLVVAIISLFSASSTLAYKTGPLKPISQQILFMVAGVAIAYAIQFCPTRWIHAGGYVLLGISVLCLYSLLLPKSLNPFAVTVNGATRWMRIAGITFQPSELAKLSLIIVVANMLSRIRTEEDKRKYFFRTLGLTAVTALPIFFSNLSTTILICGIVFLLWVIARIPAKYLASMAGIAVVFLVLGYCIVEFGFVRPKRELAAPFSRAVTWVNRVDRMFEDHSEEDKYVVTDDNRQELYAQVAIALGGKSPFGVLPGNSKERDYLPLAFADYIFAIIVEETGIVGAFCLIVLYLSILIRACFVSTRYADYAAMLMVMGLALMLTCQALISMLVAVGIGPVTGQPLPLISRGGTSVIITSIYFGIMMCVSREQMQLRNQAEDTKNRSKDDAPIISVD